MTSHVSSWILGSAKRAFAALAIVAGLSLAATPAHAVVMVEIKAQDITTPGVVLDSGLIPGPSAFTSGTTGKFLVETASATIVEGTPETRLFSNIITIKNSSAGTATLELQATATGVTLPPGAHLILGCSTSASAGDRNPTLDVTKVTSYADPGNVAFAHTVATGTLSGKPGISGNPTVNYVFDKGGNCDPVPFTRSGAYSVSQDIFITLAAGSDINLTYTTGVTATPEPSSLAIAGLGALGLIGYGIRRRRGA